MKPSKNILISIAIGLILAFTVIIIAPTFNDGATETTTPDLEEYQPYRVSLQGEYVCLPEIEETIQDECVPGLLIEDGTYFGIDFYLMSQTHETPSVGQIISGNGVVTPVQRLSTNQWQKYPLTGIFSVTDTLKIIE